MTWMEGRSGASREDGGDARPRAAASPRPRPGSESSGERWIGDRERATARDLLREYLPHAAARAENVAQAQHRSAGAQDDLFGDPLRRAHHRGRLDGLISREQNDACTVLRGDSGDGRGAEDVVRDGGQGLFFEQRDMLVRRGVEDETWIVYIEYVLQRPWSPALPRIA